MTQNSQISVLKMGDFKVNSTVFELKLDGRQIKRSGGSDVGDIVNKIMLVT